MDEALLAVGNGKIRVPWASTKSTQAALFAGVTSEQMRWRYRNLTKPSPVKTSYPPRKAASAKRKTRHDQPTTVPATAAAAAAAARSQQPNAGSFGNDSGHPQIEFISAGKSICGTLYVRAKCRGVATEQWISEKAVHTDPCFQAWLNSQ